MKKVIQPVVIGVIRRGDKYLFTQRVDMDPEDKGIISDFHHVWQLPGGGLEFGEDVEACLLREIKEEIGVDIEIVTLIPKLYHDVRNRVWHGLLICFLCRMENEQDRIVLNDEASAYKWWSYDELQRHETLPFTKEIVREAERINVPSIR